MRYEFFCYFIPSFIIFNIAILPFYKNVRIPKHSVYTVNNNAWLKYVKIAILIFCIFGAFGGDWFSYQKEIHRIVVNPRIVGYQHLEDLYIWIITHITKDNYLLFRFIIWSTSILCLSAGFQRLKTDTITTWSCFMVLSIAVSYAVGRGSLGFSLIIWGYSYFLLPDKKISSYIKGAILLTASLFCHKSMFLLAPLTLVSFIKFNLKRSVAIAVLLPFIIVIFRNYILLRLSTGEEMAGNPYFTLEQNKYGLGMNLWRYLYYFIIFGLIGLMYHSIIIKRRNLPIHIRRIFNFILLILLEYLTIYFALTAKNIGSDDIAWRIFAMLNIPLPIILSYMISNRASKIYYYIFNLALLMSNYFILYNAYTIY